MTASPSTAAKWKSNKAMQVKREVPTTLDPLDCKPKPKENIDLVQFSKEPNRDGGKHAKPRPHVLESLSMAPSYNFVGEAVENKA